MSLPYCMIDDSRPSERVRQFVEALRPEPRRFFVIHGGGLMESRRSFDESLSLLLVLFRRGDALAWIRAESADAGNDTDGLTDDERAQVERALDQLYAKGRVLA